MNKQTQPLAFIPARFGQLAFAFYMAALMAFLMTMVLVFINTGFDEHFWQRALRSYLIAMPIAFICVLLVRPLVVKLIQVTVKSQ